MQKIIMGNWKMNGNTQSIKKLCEGLSKIKFDRLKLNVVVFPPSVYVKETILQLPKEIGVGLQNITFNDDGAYTGEISRTMLEDLNCNYLLIGHSERRMLFNESDKDVFNKLKKVIKTEIIPVVCIGESLENRKNNDLKKVLSSQLSLMLNNLSAAELAKVIIAYEPIWSIGTGVVASLDQIQKTHELIRSIIANVNDQLAKNIKIIYGGSLKSVNVKDILSLVDVDGGLVGGASLEVLEFNEIINQANIICTQ